MTFDQLIAPIDPAVFFKDFFEKKPLLVQRGNPQYFSSLLTGEELGEVLAYGAASGRIAVTMSSAARKIALSEYVQEKHGGGAVVRSGINWPEVYRLYAQEHATIIVNQVGQASDKLAEFVHGVTRRLRAPTGLNIFVTPDHAQCFEAHFDEHDLFILQLEGKKRWKVYENLEYLPLEPQNKKVYDFSGLKLLYDVELEAGDTLYFPRGFVHEVTTAGSASLHITVGCMNTTWVRLLMDWLARVAQESPTLRQGCYQGRWQHQDALAQVKETLRDLVTNHLTLHNLDALAARYQREPAVRPKLPSVLQYDGLPIPAS